MDFTKRREGPWVVLTRFKRKFENLLGVDIGSTSVKVLELSKWDNSCQVEFYGMEPLHANAIIDRHVSDVEGVGEAIKRLLSGSGRRARRAATALAGVSAITTTFAADASLTDEEIDALINLGSDRYIPIQDAVYDFEIQGLSESHPGQAEVLLGAGPKEHVALVQAALKAGAVRPAAVEMEVLALTRALAWMGRLPHHQGDGAVAIMDLGTAARLRVFARSGCFYEQEQAFDTAPRSAENNAPSLNEQRQAVIRCMAEALRSFHKSEHHQPISALVLAGGGALMEGLVEAAQKALDLPLTALNPFQGMSLAPSIDADALSRDAPALAVACGLSLRG